MSCESSSAGNRVVLDPDVLETLSTDLDISRSIFETVTGVYMLKPVTKLLVNDEEVDAAEAKFE